jgi:hypothetical protein
MPLGGNMEKFREFLDGLFVVTVFVLSFLLLLRVVKDEYSLTTASVYSLLVAYLAFKTSSKKTEK